MPVLPEMPVFDKDEDGFVTPEECKWISYEKKQMHVIDSGIGPVRASERLLGLFAFRHHLRHFSRSLFPLKFGVILSVGILGHADVRE